MGESEAGIRSLFEAAETEHRRMGNRSALHVIIFDEIDAVCKARGTAASSANSGVYDSVVNQILTMIDGLSERSNILVIGTTNRKDLLDDALLRPGRLDVSIEVSLPSGKGREQILAIHTRWLEGNLDAILTTINRD